MSGWMWQRILVLSRQNIYKLDSFGSGRTTNIIKRRFDMTHVQFIAYIYRTCFDSLKYHTHTFHTRKHHTLPPCTHHACLLLGMCLSPLPLLSWSISVTSTIFSTVVAARTCQLYASDVVVDDIIFNPSSYCIACLAALTLAYRTASLSH